MSESIPIVKAAAATAGGIDFPLLFLGAGAVASLGLGLNWLIKSNNPERMSTEKQEIKTIYLINLYKQEDRYQIFTNEAPKKWISESISINSGKIDVTKGDVVEYESLYEQSL